MILRATTYAFLGLAVSICVAWAAQPFETPPGQASYEYMCGTWVPEAPNTRWVLLDVCMCGWDGGSVYHEPTEAQREVIRSLGGKILYEFNVPFIRARLPFSEVENLDFWCWAQSVPHPKRYPVDLLIGLEEPLSDRDREFLSSLGVVILSESSGRPSIHAIVPDASIPAIRSSLALRYLEPNFRICPLRDDGRTIVRGSLHGQSGFPGSQAPQERLETWGRLKAHYR
jgi:hypothetical protein